jgi:hypothetical protein
MKPGVNEIRVSYKVNYSSNQRDFSHRLFYATGPTKVLILPASLQVSGPGIQPAGSDSRTQAAIYHVTPAAKPPSLQFKVVGNAPVVSDEGEHGPSDGTTMINLPRLCACQTGDENKIVIPTGFGVGFASVILFAIRQKSASRQTVHPRCRPQRHGNARLIRDRYPRRTRAEFRQSPALRGR